MARGPWPLTANIMSSNRPNLPVPPASRDDWSDLVHPGTAGDTNSNGSGSGIDDWENLLTEQPAPQAPLSACSSDQWSQCQSQWQLAMSARGQ